MARAVDVRAVAAPSPCGVVVFREEEEGGAESVVYNDCLTPELPPKIINRKKQH